MPKPTPIRLASTHYSKAQLIAAQTRELAMSRNLYRRMIADGVSDAKRAELHEQYALKLAIYDALTKNVGANEYVHVEPGRVREAIQAKGEQYGKTH